MLRPVGVFLLPITSSPLAIIALALAACRSPALGCCRATLSGLGAISGGTLAALGRPKHDPCAGAPLRGRFSRRQLAITLGADLIALRCRPIAIVRSRITTGGRADTPRLCLLTEAGAASAQPACVVILGLVATLLEDAIAGLLIHLGRGLVVIGRGLIAVRRGLVSIGECLVAFRERLVISQCDHSRGGARLLGLRLPVWGIRGPIA